MQLHDDAESNGGPRARSQLAVQLKKTVNIFCSFCKMVLNRRPSRVPFNIPMEICLKERSQAVSLCGVGRQFELPLFISFSLALSLSLSLSLSFSLSLSLSLSRALSRSLFLSLSLALLAPSAKEICGNVINHFLRPRTARATNAARPDGLYGIHVWADSWKVAPPAIYCEVNIRAPSAAITAKFNISPGRWHYFWPVAIVPTKRWGEKRIEATATQHVGTLKRQFL
jgi:hypothetical protein